MQISRGSAFGFTGSRNSRANVSAALPASAARFTFDSRPPFARASAIASEISRRRSRPARKRGSSISSVTGNTCLEISEVMRNTRMS